MTLSLRKPVIQPLWAVTFSLHPSVPTQWYRVTASTALRHLQLARPVPEQPPNFRKTSEEIMNDCRRLLHTTYCRGMGWYPSPDSHTQFRIVNNDMLCDRYDEVGVWVAIVDPRAFSSTKNPVLACGRVLAGKLASEGQLIAHDSLDPDLDILGYSDCPPSFQQWVQQQGAGRVMEGQRMAVAAACRGLHLPYHLHSLAAMPFLSQQSPLYDPTAFCLTAPTHATERFVQMGGGQHRDPSWRIRYEKADALHPLPIYTIPVRAMWSRIQKAVQRAQMQHKQQWPTARLPPSSMIQYARAPKLSHPLISRL